MLYDYQYDIAALIATGLLAFTYRLRRGYRTNSYLLFMSVLGCDMLAAMFDLASCFAISYPNSHSLVYNYITALGYLFFFNMVCVMFLVYIYTRTRVSTMSKTVKIISVVCTIYYFVTIWSSPWTHLTAYFDENQVYQHGPLMTSLFVIPFLVFVVEIYMFYQARNRMNRYQLLASVAFIVTMVVCLIIQILFPRILICTLGCALIMSFIYIAFENPAYYSYRDTQCPNRTAFHDTIRRFQKNEQAIQLIACRLDDFDYLSDTYGQAGIDILNLHIADDLYHHFQSKAFHLSGELNVLVLNATTDAAPYIKRLEEMFATPFLIDEDQVPVDVTISTLPVISSKVPPSDIEILLDRFLKSQDTITDIDAALLDIHEKKAHRSALLHAIQKAIANDEFQVYYQPIRHTFTGTFDSAEALIRLITPELGFINPEEMIILAEENGYIDTIGEMVFRKVCRFIRDNGIQSLGVKYIEINLSPLQCMNETLVDRFYDIMQEYDVKPSQINLEITETAQMEEKEQIINTINRFANIGVGLSIDDYGSGFAAADYLIKLPVSIVKIDKMILWNAMKNANAMIVLTNTIRMIKDLGRHIVVEGVEDNNMVEVLTATGCDYMQGYLYSKPVPEADYVAFLEKYNS